MRDSQLVAQARLVVLAVVRMFELVEPEVARTLAAHFPRVCFVRACGSTGSVTLEQQVDWRREWVHSHCLLTVPGQHG
jgi:Tfp pilus assembly ATPase PilU